MKNKLYTFILALINLITISLFAQSGKNPIGGLIESNGRLYGVTDRGGIYGAGTLYEYNISTGNIITKINFDDFNTGRNPISLIKASDGNIYGATSLGATNNRGVFFKYDPVANVFSSIVHFANVQLKFPHKGLIQVGNKIYGTTQYNDLGFSGAGSVYIYDIITQSFETVHLYASPTGGLTLAPDSSLYGLTNNGGNDNLGSIFKLYIGINVAYMVHSFSVLMPSNWPHGALTADSQGDLWGVSESFSEEIDGTVFKYNIYSNTISEMLEFNFWDYPSCVPVPIGDIEMLPNGKIYYLADYAGSGCKGALYEYIPSSNTNTVKYSFNGIDGNKPNSLMRSVSRKFYGTTYNGGSYGLGTIFAYNLVTNTFTKLHDFGEASFKTGINNNELNSNEISHYTLYPNPAADMISISSEQKETKQNFIINIIDIQGRVVKATAIANPTFPVQVDLEGVNDGMYTLKLQDDNSISTIKLVKTQ